MTDDHISQDAEDVRKPPYGGFGAFHSFIERLGRSGVPAVIDRHFIGGSGTNQSQLSGALTFLHLIDEESKPTRELHDLAEKEDERPAVYRQILERHYEGALALGPRATQNQLDQWFRQLGVSGETIRKAESFFLSMAKMANVETSPHFKPTRSATTTTRRRATTRKKPSESPPPAPPGPPGGSTPRPRIHPAVTSLLDKIPAPGTAWSKHERDLLVTTFGNLLDLFHPVISDESDGKQKGERPSAT
jgi:hypothetical protein